MKYWWFKHINLAGTIIFNQPFFLEIPSYPTNFSILTLN